MTKYLVLNNKVYILTTRIFALKVCTRSLNLRNCLQRKREGCCYRGSWAEHYTHVILIHCRETLEIILVCTYPRYQSTSRGNICCVCFLQEQLTFCWNSLLNCNICSNSQVKRVLICSNCKKKVNCYSRLFGYTCPSKHHLLCSK